MWPFNMLKKNARRKADMQRLSDLKNTRNEFQGMLDDVESKLHNEISEGRGDDSAATNFRKAAVNLRIAIEMQYESIREIEERL